jgi:hypothetical protein
VEEKSVKGDQIAKQWQRPSLKYVVASPWKIHGELCHPVDFKSSGRKKSG